MSSLRAGQKIDALQLFFYTVLKNLHDRKQTCTEGADLMCYFTRKDDRKLGVSCPAAQCEGGVTREMYEEYFDD